MLEKKIANYGHIGPGGMNCVCCGPAPGKERKAFIRARKRSLKQKHKQDIRNQVAEYQDEDETNEY